MKRIIDFQSHLGDMLGESRSIVFKEPMAPAECETLLEGFAAGGYAQPPQNGDALAEAIQKRVWAHGSVFSATDQLDANGLTYLVSLPVYPNTSFEEALAASTQEPRLIPFSSPDFDFDLPHICARLTEDIRRGAKGLFLHPVLQNHSLQCPRLLAAVETFGNAGLPIVIQFGREQYYRADSPLAPTAPAERGDVAQVLALAAQYPHYSFVLTHGPTGAGAELDAGVAGVAAQGLHNVYFTTAFKTAAAIRALADAVGARRLLFGSGYPLSPVDAALAACQEALADRPEALEDVLHHNAVSLTRLYE